MVVLLNRTSWNGRCAVRREDPPMQSRKFTTFDDSKGDESMSSQGKLGKTHGRGGEVQRVVAEGSAAGKSRRR